MTTVPAKIVMRGTSQMSLHDRFSTLPPEQKPSLPPPVVRRSAPAVAATYATPSLKQNQKLAKDMENRPTVMRALRRGYSNGVPVHNRLPVQYRLGSYPMKRSSFGYQRRGRFSAPRARGSFYGQQRFASFPPRYRPFGTSLSNAGVWNQPQPYYRGGSYRGMRFGVRGRGSRGRIFHGSFRSPLKVSKEELDKQIDEYMAKTSGRLDHDIDSYMNDLNL